MTDFADQRDAAIAEPVDVAGIIGTLMAPHYTMAREREIHEALVGPLSSSQAQAAPAVSEATEAWDLDDCLFG